MFNYYAEQLFRAVADQVANSVAEPVARLQFIISDITPSDAQLLLDKCSGLCHTKGLGLQFWLAEEYRSKWSAQDVAKFEGRFANGNLTQYRNEVVPNTLQMLLGTAHVTDKGSLGDFYQCDGESLWAVSMRRSFKSWIERFFEDHGVSVLSGPDNEKLEGILAFLREISGLQMVSKLLSSIPEEFDANSPTELVAELLRRLAPFNLPNLQGFALRKTKSKVFRYYAEAAAEFFNYNMFLEDSKRKKALAAIKAFKDKAPEPPLDFSPFTSRGEMLEALAMYVMTGTEHREELRKADFIEILDKILAAKPAKTPGSRDTIKKLSGSPAEVVLTAVWRTLGEYRAKFPDEDVSSIDITGVMFKHDFQTSVGSAEQIKEEVLDHLRRLLGGLDELCERCIAINSSADGELVKVSSHLFRNEISTPPAKTSEPFFEFHVVVSDGEHSVRLRFAIQLPDVHPYRLAILLFDQAKAFLSAANGHCKLPVYHFEYYRELMMARDAEEIRRVMSHCINACKDPLSFGEILVSENWWLQPQVQILKKELQALAQFYRDFVEKVCAQGLYAMISLGQTPQMFSAYNQAAEAYTSSMPEAADAHAVAAMLMRAFLVVDRHNAESLDVWSAAKYEASGVVTILHPAMLEMVQAQLQFLFESFSRLAEKELQEESARQFRDAKWRYYVDMAELKMPITGLTVDGNNQRFEVCSGGDELVHRVGSITVDQKLSATRFLTRYDRVDDDDISDAEMFRESSESRHLFRILKEYYRIHIGASDGLSVAIYRNEDVQPVLAAIDQFAKWLPKEDRLKDAERPEKYAMKVVFFSESSDTSVVANWLSQWQDFLDDAEEEDPDYAAMRFTVSHRIIRRDDQCQQFAEMIKKEVDADIFVFYNFIKPDSQGCVFQTADEFDVTKSAIKFPILEQAQCAKTSPDEICKRSQIVSNRQFKICTRHTEIIARLRDGSCKQNTHHIVLATGDYSPWRTVIDNAHIASEWVVCIDALIDKALLALGGEEAAKRELIGFGSGVGLHGEKNYTISTQKHSFATIHKQLLSSMGQVYRYGKPEQFEVIANALLHEATELAGLSMIRSLGPSEYVRDFMAYSLMHRILPLDENGNLCDRIFSIDAYSHWFDQASEDDKTHPDLLWLRANIAEDGRMIIKAKLIECKMANQSEEHLEKAALQIQNGLKVLSEVFRPKDAAALEDGFGFGHANRPDQRYWHLQLHRLIASSVRLTNTTDMGKYLIAMERLASGEFEIEWGAGVFAFWTDSESADMKCNEHRTFSLDDVEYSVPVYEAGCKFVYRLCADEASPTLEWSAPVLQVPAIPENDDMPERELSEEGEDDPDTQPGSAEPISSGINDDEPVATEPDAPVSPSQTIAAVCHETSSPVPDRILLGKTKDGREVFWEFGHPKLNNRHFLIFGNSGMGKTYAIQAILCEFGRKGQNSLIVDYTNGFLPNQLQPKAQAVLQPCQNVVKKNKLPINPFKKQSQDIGFETPIEEGDIDVAKRVTSIFDSVYQIGDQQVSVLIDAFKQGLESFKEKMSLEKVLPILQGFIDDGVHPKNSVQTIANKLKPFIDEAPFRADSMMGWSELFSDAVKRCQVFQMAMIDRSTARILTEFILWDLWAFASSGGSESTPRIVVLDEVQNLDQRLESPLGKYLTEGRKFGLCVMAATQTLSNLKKDEQARLFQAGHKLFFRPADPEINQYTDFVTQAAGGGDKNQWRALLTSLSKGECLSIGPALNLSNGNFVNQVNRIKISALEERGF